MENKENEIDLRELTKNIWKERKRIIIWGIIGIAVGIVISFSIPKQYKTVVKIAPEDESSKLSMNNSMGGLAEMAGFDIGSGGSVDGISKRIYPEIIQSTPFLLEFANIEVENDNKKIKFYDYITKEQRSPWWSYIVALPMKAAYGVINLFKDEDPTKVDTINIFKPSAIQQYYIKALNTAILVDLDMKVGILTLTVTMQDPLIAAIISDSLISNLQRYMIEYRTRKTRNDLEMNSRRMKEAQSQYYTADSIYANAIDRNQNLIAQSARIKLDRLANEKTIAFSTYQQIATQVEMNKVKLQENTPIATIIEPASVATKASSPNKLIILIAFGFLGGFAAICSILVKQLFGKNYDI